MKFFLRPLLIISLFTSTMAFAEKGYIALSARVTMVSSTAGAPDSFFVRLKSGQGPCISNPSAVNVYFTVAESLDRATFERSYANALIALTGGHKVNVYNYKDKTCEKAVAIELID